MFRVNTNIQSINGQRNLLNASNDLSTRLNRLSSGLRIIRAADDAAALTASEGMRAQLAGQRTANDNMSRAVALLQTADSGLEQIGNMFTRLKELAGQASDGSLNPANRSAINAEATALVAEIDRIAQSTMFNGLTLISAADGKGTAFTFYIGDGTGTSTTTQQAGLAMPGVALAATGIGTIGAATVAFTVADLLIATSARALVNVADQAVNSVAQLRTQIGAFQNRIEASQRNMQLAIENTQNAESTIRDADFAAEASALTRAQILVQAGTAMLSQANLLPQTALSFIG